MVSGKKGGMIVVISTFLLFILLLVVEFTASNYKKVVCFYLTVDN